MIVSRTRPGRSRPPPLDPDQTQDLHGFFRNGPRPPAGPIGQALGVVFLVILTIFATWNLAHAAATGVISGRHGWYSLAEDPFGFWLNVVAFGLCALIGHGLGALLIFSLATRGRETRKIDVYLQRRADEGGSAAAIPPRFR